MKITMKMAHHHHQLSGCLQRWGWCRRWWSRIKPVPGNRTIVVVLQYSILEITSNNNPCLLKSVTPAWSIPPIMSWTATTTQSGFVQIVTQLRPPYGGVAQEALRYLIQKSYHTLTLNHDSKNLFMTFFHNYISWCSPSATPAESGKGRRDGPWRRRRQQQQQVAQILIFQRPTQHQARARPSTKTKGQAMAMFHNTRNATNWVLPDHLVKLRSFVWRISP